MVKKCRNPKLTWQLIATVLITIFSIVLSVDAGTWRDDFENENLDGWTLRARFSAWSIQNGFLNSEIRVPRGLPGTADFLEFSAFPGPYEHFTVTFIKPRLFRIALGKMFPETGSPRGFFYTFSSHNIMACQIERFGGDVCINGFRGWLPRSPGTNWQDKPIKLTVNFDAGRFQFFADDKLRADFEDLHFDKIEFVSVLVMGIDGQRGELDAFEISGPGIGGLAIQPKGKLATTWGHLKRQNLF